MSVSERARAMAASLARAARTLGVPPDGVALVSDAYARAMEPRVVKLPDDHDPLYLHPGRTALVLLRDAGVVDPEILAAACLAESEADDLRVDPSGVAPSLGRRVASLAAVPRHDAEDLAEILVTAAPDARLVALAERLDAVRHAHMRPLDDERMRRELEVVRAIYLPVAERTDERIARRFRHWSIAFARRIGAD